MTSSVDGLRILQIAGTAEGGSWFFDQVTELAARGHRVYAVVPGEGPLLDRLRAAGITTYVIPFKGFAPRDLPRVAGAQVNLIGLVRRLKPDIIHSHLLKAIVMGRVAGFLGDAGARVSQVPGSVHFDAGWLRRIDRATLWIDDVTVGSCKDIARRYAEVGARHVAVSYYGCDVHRIDPSTSGEAFRREFGVPDDVATVGMVAHMYPTQMAAYRDIGVKGHEVFIDAAAIVRARRPATRFFVVGDELVGDGSYRARLEARSASLGLDGALTFTGHRSDIPSVMAAMDVLTNPSLSESASYTMIEALLMRRGVVASNVGGLPDTVQHEETGLLVPPGDADALASALLQLLDSPEERAAMGAMGRQRVIERFDIKRTVDSLEEIYRSTLARKRR